MRRVKVSLLDFFKIAGWQGTACVLFLLGTAAWSAYKFITTPWEGENDGNR
jgi:hypothetical protein